MALPRTTQEQRSPFYTDVEDLILPGFLNHRVEVNGHKLTLRSLGPGDLFLLRARAGDGAEDEEWKFWAIATSIWMVDGDVVLDHPNVIPRLYAMIRRLPVSLTNILFSLILGLFARLNKASRTVIFYCYEQQSRFRWRSLAGQPPHLHAGIPGIARIGTNHIQRMWFAFNEAEDQHLTEVTQWNWHKFAVSVHSPKGVRKIDSGDRQRLQAELDRRQAELDRFYYETVGVLAPQANSNGAATRTAPVEQLTLLGSKSSDDLADEMRRWVSGDMDLHDRVIAEYKQQITARQEEEKQQTLERAKALQKRLEAEEILTSPTTALVGYTTQQLNSLIKDRQPGKQGGGVRWISEGEKGGRDYLYNKYLKKPPDSGRLAVQGDRVIVDETVPPLGPSLNNLIEDRPVAFSSGGDSEEEQPEPILSPNEDY